MEEDNKYNSFLAALDAEIKEHWYKRTSKLSVKAGMSQGNLSKIVNRKTKATLETQHKIAVACGYKSVSDFIQSTKGVKETNNRMINIDNQDDWEHFKVTRKFKNKELAIKANEALVELESIDSIQFAKAVVDIMERLKSAQKQKKEPGRKAAGGE